MGDVKMFNLASGSEEGTYQCHDSYVYHIQPSRDNKWENIIVKLEHYYNNMLLSDL